MDNQFRNVLIGVLVLLNVYLASEVRHLHGMVAQVESLGTDVGQVLRLQTDANARASLSNMSHSGCDDTDLQNMVHRVVTDEVSKMQVEARSRGGLSSSELARIQQLQNRVSDFSQAFAGKLKNNVSFTTDVEKIDAVKKLTADVRQEVLSRCGK